MKLRSSMLHKEARRKERVTREKQRKDIPIHWKSWWKQSGWRLPRGDEAEQQTHVCKQLCRWLLQRRWEICMISDYLTRFILKIMSGSLEL